MVKQAWRSGKPRYRGFYRVPKTSNWHSKNLLGVGPRTVICAKSGDWSAFVDDEPLDLWFTSAEEAIDVAIETAVAWATYETADPAPEQPDDVPDCLRVIGLTPPVDIELLKLQHRNLERLTHPDRPGGNSAEFRRIQSAFEEALRLA